MARLLSLLSLSALLLPLAGCGGRSSLFGGLLEGDPDNQAPPTGSPPLDPPGLDPPSNPPVLPPVLPPDVPPDVPEPQDCTFTDLGLEEAVRQALEVDEDVPLDPEELASIHRLEASGQAILFLEGLECLTGLQELDLSDNSLHDISLLAALPQLEVLNLSDNDVGDLSSLATLVDLESLDVSANELVSLDSLPPLPSLVSLNVADNSLLSLAPLGRAPSLTHLDLSRTGLSRLDGIEALSELAALRLDELLLDSLAPLSSLELHELSINGDVPSNFEEVAHFYTSYSLEPVWQQASLQKLELRHVRIHDADVFTRLPELEELTLLESSVWGANAFASLTSLEKLHTSLDASGLDPILPPHLRVLTLESGRLESLEFLRDMTTLEELTIQRHAAIIDLEPLAGLNLQRLTLSGSVLGNLAPLGQITSLRELRIGGTSTVVLLGIAAAVDDLAQLTNLEFLELETVEGLDLSPLSTLGKLRSLRLTGHDNVLALPHLPELAEFDGEAPLDLTSLAALTGLERLALPRIVPDLDSIIAGMPGLQTLETSYPQVSWNEIERLDGFSNLQITAEEIEAAGPEATLWKVRTLQLYSEPGDGRPWTEHLPFLPQLEHLTIHLTPEDDLGVLSEKAPRLRTLNVRGSHDLDELPELPFLRSLRIGSANLCSAMRDLQDTWRLTSLQFLLQSCSGTVELPADLPHLRALVVASGSSLELEGWQRFSELMGVSVNAGNSSNMTVESIPSHPSLRRLDTNYTQVDSWQTEGNGFPQLQRLRAYDSSQDLSGLGPVPRLDTIQTIGDTVGFPDAPALTRLRLAYQVSALPSFPELRLLALATSGAGPFLSVDGVPAQPELRFLDLGRGTGALSSDLPAQPHLRVARFDLGQVPWGEALALGDAYPELVSLVVQAEEVDDLSLGPALEMLSIEVNAVTEEALSDLAQSDRLSWLRLRTEGTLPPQPEFPELRSLHWQEQTEGTSPLRAQPLVEELVLSVSRPTDTLATFPRLGHLWQSGTWGDLGTQPEAWSLIGRFLPSASAFPELVSLQMTGNYTVDADLLAEHSQLRRYSGDWPQFSDPSAAAELPLTNISVSGPHGTGLESIPSLIWVSAGDPSFDLVPLSQNPSFAEGDLVFVGFTSTACDRPGVDEMIASGVVAYLASGGLCQ